MMTEEILTLAPAFLSVAFAVIAWARLTSSLVQRRWPAIQDEGKKDDAQANTHHWDKLIDAERRTQDAPQQSKELLVSSGLAPAKEVMAALEVRANET